MKVVARILKTIFNVLFYLFVGIMLAVLVLYICGIKPYITMSGSMEPDIHTGSICFVNTKASYDEVEVGDVIAFKIGDNSLITHRAISITEEGIETKGDANDVSDGICTTEHNFSGKTLFSVPYIGYAVKFIQEAMHKPYFVFVAVGIIAVVAIIDCIDISGNRGKSSRPKLGEGPPDKSAGAGEGEGRT